MKTKWQLAKQNLRWGIGTLFIYWALHLMMPEASMSIISAFDRLADELDRDFEAERKNAYNI